MFYFLNLAMIIASVCTIPGRAESLFKVLGSLLEQTVLPNSLLISVSDFYPRNEKYFPKEDLARIEKFIETYPIPSQIVKDNVDIGSCKKLLSPINHVDTKNGDLIFTFDDDALLTNRAIESLVSAWEKNPNAVYSIMGHREESYIHQERIDSSAFDYFVVDIVGGYRGVLYPVNLIEKDEFISYIQEMIDLHKSQNLIAMHDDHIFSYFFKMKKIERRVAPFLEKRFFIDYRNIENSDGITVDKNTVLSMNIIKNYFSNNQWVIDNPY
jgi:hypothetical protein